MKKTRPCVVISPNEMNKYLQTIIIAPITSQSKSYPTRIQIKQVKTNGYVVLDQIRTIGKQRLVKILGILTEKEIEKVKSVIKETLVD